MLQRLIAALLGLLGLAAAALGIASATAWRADDPLVATATADTQTLVTEPGVLEVAGDPVTVTVRAQGAPVVLAVGRDTDVLAWVGTDPHELVTGLADWHDLALSTGESAQPEPSASATEAATDQATAEPSPSASAGAEPATATAADPSGSDMWVTEVTGDGSASLEWTAPSSGRWSLLAVSLGDTKPTLELSWPQEVTTPWLWPGVAVGVLLLAIAAILAIRIRRSSAGGDWHDVSTGMIAVVTPQTGGAAAPLPTTTGTVPLIDPATGQPMTRRQIREAEAAAASRRGRRGSTGAIPVVTGAIPTVTGPTPVATPGDGGTSTSSSGSADPGGSASTAGSGALTAGSAGRGPSSAPVAATTGAAAGSARDASTSGGTSTSSARSGERDAAGTPTGTSTGPATSGAGNVSGEPTRTEAGSTPTGAGNASGVTTGTPTSAASTGAAGASDAAASVAPAASGRRSLFGFGRRKAARAEGTAPSAPAPDAAEHRGSGTAGAPEADSSRPASATGNAPATADAVSWRPSTPTSRGGTTPGLGATDTSRPGVGAEPAPGSTGSARPIGGPTGSDAPGAGRPGSVPGSPATPARAGGAPAPTEPGARTAPAGSSASTAPAGRPGFPAPAAGRPDERATAVPGSPPVRPIDAGGAPGTSPARPTAEAPQPGDTVPGGGSTSGGDTADPAPKRGLAARMPWRRNRDADAPEPRADRPSAAGQAPAAAPAPIDDDSAPAVPGVDEEDESLSSTQRADSWRRMWGFPADAQGDQPDTAHTDREEDR